MSRYVRKIGPKLWLICGLAVWLTALVTMRANTATAGVAAAVPAERSATVLNSPQAAPQPALASLTMALLVIFRNTPPPSL